VAAIKSVDLREKLPPIGPVSLLRAEWKVPSARFVLVWYAIREEEQALALRLDLDKQAFLDDLAIDDMNANRAVKAHAPDVVKVVAAKRQALVRAAVLKAAS